MSTPLGAQSAWRQLVDLIGRRRVPADPGALARLKAIRDQVPPTVRAASARAAAFADPPAALVELFADDDCGIAAPVLRTARLGAEEWVRMLPALAPAGRSILRHRRDLPPEVGRALASFGTVDFVLGAGHDVGAPAGGDDILTAEPVADTADLPATRAAITALRSPRAGGGLFPVADLVARLDAYHRHREAPPEDGACPDWFGAGGARAQAFRFETDAFGVLRWVDGAARAPLIGLSLDLDHAMMPGHGAMDGAAVDGVAGGAFRRRAAFKDARLTVGGRSDASGQWRINGIPVFDRGSGRFTGYRGTARRPRPDESAERVGPVAAPASDALRQLVHELRTPANAIGGFAEMIESQMCGPVSEAYRAHAATIRGQADDLLAAIDDIDMAARIEAKALDLRPGDVPVTPLLRRLAADLAPLAALRGSRIEIAPADDLAVAGDDRAVERLITRLATALVASGSAGERIGIAAVAEAEGMVAILFDRPRALAAWRGDGLLTIDGDSDADREGAPLLGTGFALRLACNLAAELGGALLLDEARVALRLPAAVPAAAGQLSSS